MDSSYLAPCQPWTKTHTNTLMCPHNISYIKCINHCKPTFLDHFREIFDQNSDLCISGGSLLILALCSITSFATFPLRKQTNNKREPVNICDSYKMQALKTSPVTLWDIFSQGCSLYVGYSSFISSTLDQYLYLKRLPLKKRLLLETVRT